MSGGIAAYKAVELCRRLMKAGEEVQVAMTEGAARFVQPLSFQALSGRPVLTDLFTAEGAEIPHVELAHTVSKVVLAPATANLIAKLALGIADDALTTTLLSTRAPTWLAPAMESQMWSHPATQSNIATLKARGLQILGPASGALASGRSGAGRMLEPDEICAAVIAEGPLSGRKILITAGPTWEPLDPVRVLSNRSTGAMGIALAEEAARRGAEVHLLLGPTHRRPAPHPGLRLHLIETAAELLKAVQDNLHGCELFIGAAAVSDYRPAEAQPHKLKRSDPRAQQLALVENPDVLATAAATLREAGRPAVVVGFAAETEALVRHARDKLRRKGCDLVIANRVGPSEGFGPEATSVVAVGADSEARFGPASKAEVAAFILDQASARLSS